MVRRPTLLPGQPHPLGSRPLMGGTHFGVHSCHARRIELLLYDRVDAAQPARVIALDDPAHRTWHYWHVFVPGVRPGQLYAWRAHGDFDPARGCRFDAGKLLLDPYGRAVEIPPDWSRAAARGPGANDAQAAKCVVCDDHDYDRQGDRPPCRPFAQTVICELHARCFTRHVLRDMVRALHGAGLEVTLDVVYNHTAESDERGPT